MPEQDTGACGTVCELSLYIVSGQLGNCVRADISHVAGEVIEGQRNTWQHAMTHHVQPVVIHADGAHPHARKPVKLHGKNGDEQNTEPENWHRNANIGEQVQDVIQPTVLECSSQQAQRDRQHNRHQQRRAHQPERGRNALADHLQHRAVVNQRIAQIALKNIFQPQNVLRH
ncbi:hypothetical protein D3C76_1215360 [compost metagenome]